MRPRNVQSAVDELTRDWDDDEASQADGGETIESIESFMQVAQMGINHFR